MKRTRDSVLETFKPRGRGVEIGLFIAGLSQRMLDQVQSLERYLIDAWVHFDMNDIHDKIGEKFAKRFNSGQAEILRGTAMAMPPLPSYSADA